MGPEFRIPRSPVSSQAAELQLEITREPHEKPDPSKPLAFGKNFTDHMLMVEWTEKKGWGQPRIQPFQNLMLHPACSGLHYSLQAWRPTSVPVFLHLFPLAGCTALGLFSVCPFLLRSLVFQAEPRAG